jgi:hypothetical protein
MWGYWTVAWVSADRHQPLGAYTPRIAAGLWFEGPEFLDFSGLKKICHNPAFTV